MFIALEGIDGAGKTTAAKVIAEKLGYAYSGQKALSDYMEIEESQYLSHCTNFRNNVDSDCNKMYWLYGLSCLLAADINDVVCDRHLATVDFWYGNDENDSIAKTVYSLTRKPDVTFLLDVSLEKAVERVNNKIGVLGKNDRVYIREIEKAKKAPLFKRKAIKFFLKHNLYYIIIETDGLTASQVVDEITMHIAEYRRRNTD